MHFRVGDVVVIDDGRFGVVSRVSLDATACRVRVSKDVALTSRAIALRHPTRDEATTEAERLVGRKWKNVDTYPTLDMGLAGTADYSIRLKEWDVWGSMGQDIGMHGRAETPAEGIRYASLAVIKGIILGEIAAPSPVTDDEDATLAQMGMEVETPALRKVADLDSTTLSRDDIDRLRFILHGDVALAEGEGVKFEDPTPAADPVVTALLRLIAEGAKVASVTLEDGRVLRPVVRWEVSDDDAG